MIIYNNKNERIYKNKNIFGSANITSGSAFDVRGTASAGNNLGSSQPPPKKFIPHRKRPESDSGIDTDPDSHLESG